MRDDVALTHKFVEFVPNVLEERTLYVSMEYATVIHQCCCGCGRKVVTPLSPPGWNLTFDGESISLYPSIGSWNLPCRSHYWIKNNRAVWAPPWTQKQIDAGRANETSRKERHYNQKTPGEQEKTGTRKAKESFRQRLKKWFK
jgi:hypothetical protein